jgi:hypothetical protein
MWWLPRFKVIQVVGMVDITSIAHALSACECWSLQQGV